MSLAISNGNSSFPQKAGIQGAGFQRVAPCSLPVASLDPRFRGGDV